MTWSIKLLTLVGILIIATYMPEVVTNSDEVDEETSLKQALFLVGLLKSDFAKVLREKEGDVNRNITEDANTTCPLPPEDSNSTVAFNETAATESVTAVAAVSPAGAASATSYPPLPGAPVLQFSSWPPLPMPGYLPPQGPFQQRNFPDDYRFPYRFNRRRMMPDYYYYDSPVQRRGNFRRQNIPNDDLGINTATAQAQTTINNPSTPIEATSLHVEATTNSSSTLSTITELSTSKLPPSVSTISPSTLAIVEPEILSTVEPSTLLETVKRTLPITETTTQPSTSDTVAVSKVLQTKSRVKTGVKTPVMPFKEAKTTSHKKKKLRLKKAVVRHLRHHETTPEKCPSEDIELSQAASELIKEFNGSKTENMSNILDQVTKDSLQNSNKHRTSMKIYLKGSTRLPVPLPENNAFCHAYPNNALCGTML